eukprot:gb/GECH01009897.1/.p1 GENE.gb/GECH01009897.1/~~gb/GECH01009897.1/.p1  ORF type:complete len:194 (+),score=3.86 gb/GECH01009897.1/:1-582(+)
MKRTSSLIFFVLTVLAASQTLADYNPSRPYRVLKDPLLENRVASVIDEYKHGVDYFTTLQAKYMEYSQNPPYFTDADFAHFSRAIYNAFAWLGCYRGWGFGHHCTDDAMDAAACYAGHTMLSHMYTPVNWYLQEDSGKFCETIPNGKDRERGKYYGKLAAKSVLKYDLVDERGTYNYFPSPNTLGKWNPSPPN